LLAAIKAEGTSAIVARELERLPADLLMLHRDGGLSLGDLSPLSTSFDAATWSDFAAVATSGSSPDHGLADVLTRLQKGVRRRVALGRAWSIVESLGDAFEGIPASGPVTPAGSLRRFDATVGDISVLVPSRSPDTWLSHALGLLPPGDVLRRGRNSATIVVQNEQVNLRVTPPANFGGALLWHTGSREHVAALQAIARARQLQLTPAGLSDAAGHLIPSPTEAELYATLELPAIPFELRHGRDEIDLARAGQLPDIVELSDIRGDLHVHSLWSDGRDTVESMVSSAQALGYEYVAITDHSQSAAASRVLTVERLERQMDEVAHLREKYRDIVILQGAEVDILPNGRLDFPDAILGRLDIVLASLHDDAGQSGKRLTERYLGAMRHPLVHVITHPTNRLVGRRNGYDLELERLFDCAVETGTAMEIDGAPGHLDMDGDLARRAVDAGVLVTIDSDCHFADRLGRQMLFGVGTARRGGVAAAQVLNTRPYEELRAFLKRKRGG
jgi:DNA polymerase (family X)